MTTYAAEVEARRAKLLALANAATAEGLRLLDIADSLRRHAGQLEAFPPTPPDWSTHRPPPQQPTNQIPNPMKTKSPKTTPIKHRPTVAELHRQAWELGNMAVRLKIKSDLLRERAQREQLEEILDRAWNAALSKPRVVPPFDPDALAKHLAKSAGVPVVKPEAAE